MPDDNRTRRFAILIDADNTSPRIAAGLFEEVAKFGEASVRRIYGDFSSPRMRSWAVKKTFERNGDRRWRRLRAISAITSLCDAL